MAIRTLRSRTVMAALAAPCLLVLAGCGSSGSGVSTPTIPAARTFRLVGFEPSTPARPGHPTKVSFTIQQPSGKPLVRYRRGPGPHTGIHLIMVRDDLAYIIHRHPPVDTSGKVAEAVTFPAPGRYRVVVDAYPQTSGPQRNFQLFQNITVKGAYQAKPLPPFSPTVTTDGYRFTLHGRPHLKAISPALLTVSVQRADGTPARFTPWFGALAHAVFFRKGSLDYFHTHVCSNNASGCASVLGGTRVTGNSTSPGRLKVGVLVPVSGTWRLFLQTKVDGRILTAPFTLKVS